MPNQYYREIFLNYPEGQALKSYLSINIGFPSYVLMYLPAWLAIIVTATVLVLFYVVILITSKRSMLIALLLYCNLYNLLFFFDLADFLVTALRSFLTGGAFVLSYWLLNRILRSTFYSKLTADSLFKLIPKKRIN